MAEQRVSISYNAFHQPRLAGGVGMMTAFAIWTPLIILMQFVDSMTIWMIVAAVLFCVQKATAWFLKTDHKVFQAYAIYDQSRDYYDAGSYRYGNGFIGMTRVRGLGKDTPC